MRDRHLLLVTLLVVPLAVTSFARPIKFASAHTFPSGMTQSGHIATGDFNGDGFPDLAVGNNFNTVAVFLGAGDGRFGDPKIYTLTFYVSGFIAAADFNKDGKLDLAIVGGDTNGNGLALLLGKSDGTFKNPVYFKTEAAGSSIFPGVGDFNKDGNLDIYAGGNGNGEVLTGDGKGKFVDGELEPASGFSVAVGDFNGDHNLDVAVTVPFGPSVAVLLGNGNGTFQAPQIYSGFNQPIGIVASDFNGDQKLDLAVSDGLGSFVKILIGNGDGTFADGSLLFNLVAPDALVTADFNADKKTDLAVSQFGSNAVSAFPGDGKGHFRAAKSFVAGGQPAQVAVTDFNRDDAPDLAVANFGDGTVSVLLNAAGTLVVLNSSKNPSNSGDSVTFTVSVQGSVVQTPLPAGTVVFKDGSTTLGRVKLSQGQASLTTSALAKGSHNVTASYMGNAKFNPKISNVVVQLVN
ncbi:MAG: VCBS repeat-containing protein [Acidobacteria bacterium]|nr:VCBS repeat-containing protein [Acidobacteriota bacterium]